MEINKGLRPGLIKQNKDLNKIKLSWIILTPKLSKYVSKHISKQVNK